MSDLHHAWGGDLFAGPTGDLASVSGPQLGTERVLRRLLTNPGDCLWQPGYGAGLPPVVGHTAAPAAMRAPGAAAVAADPEPVIEVRSDPGGTLSLSVRYADAETADAQTLTLQMPG